MKKLIIYTLFNLLATNSFAECPDFSGKYRLNSISVSPRIMLISQYECEKMKVELQENNYTYSEFVWVLDGKLYKGEHPNTEVESIFDQFILYKRIQNIELNTEIESWSQLTVDGNIYEVTLETLSNGQTVSREITYKKVSDEEEK